MAGVISLVYDSLTASELDWVLPDLREAEIRATFFGDGELFTADLGRWKQAVAEGHALGNGAMLALHLLKDRMDGTALTEEAEDLQVLIAELSGQEVTAPMAVVDSAGRIAAITLVSGQEIEVHHVRDAGDWFSLEEKGGVYVVHEPHPQVHAQLINWMKERRDIVRLLEETD